MHPANDISTAIIKKETEESQQQNPPQHKLHRTHCSKSHLKTRTDTGSEHSELAYVFFGLQCTKEQPRTMFFTISLYVKLIKSTTTERNPFRGYIFILRLTKPSYI
jgi:hypothetical protein